MMAQGDTDTDEARTPVLAYLRVSTDEQQRSGLGLDAQRETIQRAAEYKRWTVVEWIRDEGRSGKSLERPGIQRALELMEDSGPNVMVVAKLDRLARSALDFLTVVERAKEQEWSLVVLDMGQGDELDTSSPYGKFTATMMAAVAELERGMIAKRTREAMRQAKAQGTWVGRAPWGMRPNSRWQAADSTSKRRSIPQLEPDPRLWGADVEEAGSRLTARLDEMHKRRDEGATLQGLADWLNEEGVPTTRGGRWYPSTVANVLKTMEAGGYKDLLGE